MAMIKTDREYSEILKNLTAMKGAAEKYRASLKDAGFTPEHIELGVQPLLVMQDQMEGDLAWYDCARRGDIIPLSDLTSIGRSLVALRIARGLTQRQLAERLGVNEAQVSKDERNDYHGISVERAQRIIDAMGGQVTLTVTLKSESEPEPALAEAR